MAIQVTVMSLEFDSSGRKTTKVYSKNEVTLGRLPANDVVLNRPEVSAHHAKLFVRDNEAGEAVLYLSDLGSFNGTMLENYPLKAHEEFEVRSDKRIIIGNYLIRAAHFKAGVVDEQELTELVKQESKSLFESREDLRISSSQEFEEKVPEKEAVVEESAVQDSGQIFGEPKSVFMSYATGDSSDRVGQAVEAKQEESSDDSVIVAKPEEIAVNEAIQKTEEITVETESPQAAAIEAEIAFTDETKVDEVAEAISLSELKEENKLEEEVMQEEIKTVPVECSVTPSCVENKGEYAEFVFSVDGNDLNIDLEALALFKVKGVIKRRDNGLSGVCVEMDGNKVETDEFGLFDFGSFPEGTKYSLKMNKPGYLLDCSEIVGVVEGEKEIAVNARKYVSISGRVTHKGAGLSGVAIDGGQIGSVVTNEDGYYCFENVVEGAEYKLSIAKSGYLFNKKN